jgi:hypothetical protein
MRIPTHTHAHTHTHTRTHTHTFTQEARKVLDTVLAIQPRLAPASGGGDAKSSEMLAQEVSQKACLLILLGS